MKGLDSGLRRNDEGKIPPIPPLQRGGDLTEKV